MVLLPENFAFSDDLADGMVFLMNEYNDPNVLNIGPNREVSIKELSELVAKEVGYTGKILWDTTKPNGTLEEHLILVKWILLDGKQRHHLRMV